MELLHAPVRLPPNIEDKLLRTIRFVVAAVVLVASGGIAFAEDVADPAAVKSENGK